MTWKSVSDVIMWSFPFCLAPVPARKAVGTIGWNLIRKYWSRPIKEDIEWWMQTSGDTQEDQICHSSSRCSAFSMNSTQMDVKREQCTGNRNTKARVASSSPPYLPFLNNYKGSIWRGSPIFTCWWQTCEGKGEIWVKNQKLHYGDIVSLIWISISISIGVTKL